MTTKFNTFTRKRSLNFVLALFFSGLTAIFFYIFFLETPFLGRRELAFTTLIFLVCIIPWYLFIERNILSRYQGTNRKLLWVLISLFLGLCVALIGGKLKPVYLFLPHQSLFITTENEKNPLSTGKQVGINGFSTDLGWVSFSQLIKEGEWEVTDTNILKHSSGEPATINWVGRTGSQARLIFITGPDAGRVKVIWNGASEILDLYSPIMGEQEKIQDFPIPIYAYFPGFLAWWGLASLIFFFLLLRRVEYSWLLYALPMIGVWVLFLLIFYPGFFSADAQLQWRQMVSGKYTDAHPILYALIISAASRFYSSLASVVITQILMVSIALAWGLAELGNMGVSKKVLWVLVIVSALLPFNIIMVITLFKDIPYSAALLVLSIIFLKMINSKGEWLNGHLAWLGLSIILAVIALLRINGFPVAVGSIIVLLVFFWKQRRLMMYAAGAFVLLLGLLYGPVYSYLKVRHVPEFRTVLFLHHIAAHLQAGTPLNTEETNYLGKLAPLDTWKYDCCWVNPTLMPIFPRGQHSNFDLPLLKQDLQRPTIIAFDLFLKNPSVDFAHMACTGELVWKVGSMCDDRITNGLFPLSSSTDPVETYKIYSGNLGFVAASRFPGLIRYANPYLQVFSTGFLHEIIYSPAVYLYLGILCTILLAFRKKQGLILLFLTPALIQSLVLFLVNISSDVRYQYGVVLIGLLCIGFLFVPVEKDILNNVERRKRIESPEK